MKNIEPIRHQNINLELVHNSMSALEDKIESLEQQARQHNLELCNVPERRSEDLLTLMANISSQIKFSLPQRDILAIHRVPHAHNENKTPKNIIVKLSSRILRDNLLSAFRLAKGVKTDQLGFTGTSSPIYMHEHLTLKKKQLFRQARDTAKKNNFKYVWVKHSTILVRENDSAAAIAIRSTQDISKIKTKFNPNK